MSGAANKYGGCGGTTRMSNLRIRKGKLTSIMRFPDFVSGEA
jgi:hypothetical protein